MNSKMLQAVGILFVACVILLAAVLSLLQQKPEEQQTPPEGGTPAADNYVHLLMGNPTNATEDPAKKDNFLMKKEYFALSYNNDKGTPNWVSWCLRVEDLGKAERVPFYPDDTLPKNFKHVTPNDYSGSGFDRGHMCPHSDRASTPEASKATFVMTNMIPQSPNCNQKAWADFEDYCREQVKKHHKTLYIVAGPQGVGGTGTSGPKDTLRDGKVTVPAKCWKVVLALDGGTGGPEDLARVKADTAHFLAVIMPNDQTVGHGWKPYRATVKQVEELTGYHFFDRVPASVLGLIKMRED